MRKIDSIIVHCSDSPFGDVDIIDDWHKQRGWDCIGYHFVITNRHPKTTKELVVRADGRIEHGRPVDVKGSHCYGKNSHSIGICLVGVGTFTPKQQGSLMSLLLKLCKEYNINPLNIYPHSEFSDKTCPNFGMADGDTDRDIIRRKNTEAFLVIRDMVESRLSWEKKI